MLDYEKHKFVEVGSGVVNLSNGQFQLSGQINGDEVGLTVPTSNVPTLPFSPGKYFEIQHGDTIYRCVLDDGKMVMKFINMLKIFYELNSTQKTVK